MMRGYLLTLLLLSPGCAVGPDFKPPALPAAAGLPAGLLAHATAAAPGDLGTAQRFVQDMDISAQWWTLFHSQPLTGLIDQAIKANPGLAGAQAALRQARENVHAQQGVYLPQVAAGLSASRALTPLAALSPASASGNPYYSLITPQLNVSFVPDVFGANRRAVETLAAVAESLRFQYQATYVTLTSNVVTAAFQEASLRGQIAATEETIKVESGLLAILQKQYQLGQVSMADVAAQQAALAQAKLALPPLRKQLAQQRDALIGLAGRFPGEDLTAQFQLADLRLPADLPVSLPSRLVAQRPDVRAAEETMHAASAAIGVAVAARLPQITLSGDVGAESNRLASLFAPGTAFWTLGAGLAAPIFAGGTMLHKQRAAEAAFDQATAQYKSTVLTAFQNVADALHAIQTDGDLLVAAVESERAAATSLAIVRKQLELGQVAYLALLNAENAYQQAKLALVQARAARLIDTAGLFQALGGGWWNNVARVAGR
jgi:NodT family efflux transporter outer membrane factor (OMF) lipoprotein